MNRVMLLHKLSGEKTIADGVEQAFAKEDGVQVSFSPAHEEWGRQKFFNGFEIVGVQ